MDGRRIHKPSINEISIKGKRSEKLAIFDLDDTLIISQAKIQVIDPKSGRVLKSLTPEQFNHYVHDHNHALSFTEFEDAEILRRSTFISEILEKLLNFYNSGVHVSIVTARSNTKLIRDFFLEKGINIHPDLVFAVNDPRYNFKGNVAEKKKQAIHGLIEYGYKDLVFFDDNDDNLRLAKEIEKEKDVKVETVKVG